MGWPSSGFLMCTQWNPHSHGLWRLYDRSTSLTSALTTFFLAHLIAAMQIFCSSNMPHSFPPADLAHAEPSAKNEASPDRPMAVPFLSFQSPIKHQGLWPAFLAMCVNTSVPLLPGLAIYSLSEELLLLFTEFLILCNFLVCLFIHQNIYLPSTVQVPSQQGLLCCSHQYSSSPNLGVWHITDASSLCNEWINNPIAPAIKIIRWTKYHCSKSVMTKKY